MRRNLQAIESEIRLLSETLQLEIHAIRDVIEEVADGKGKLGGGKG